MGCCYSCKHWEKASRKFPIDVQRIKPKGEFKIEMKHQKSWTIEVPSFKWKAEGPLKKILEIKGGVMKTPEYIRFCSFHGVVKAWESHLCYEPKLIRFEIDERWGERQSVIYLACWTKDGCPFKHNCYKESDLIYR